MTTLEMNDILKDCLSVTTPPYDQPRKSDWEVLVRKFSCDFSDDFVRFNELITQYEGLGELLSVRLDGNLRTEDTIILTYDFEMKHGNWMPDMIPFYSVGNGDYECLSAKEGKDSKVFYVYHEDGHAEMYASSFADWVRKLPEWNTK